jgi:hypothetical protein
MELETGQNRYRIMVSDQETRGKPGFQQKGCAIFESSEAGGRK